MSPAASSQFALNLTGIHGIAAVMAGTIFHKGDQFTVRHNRIVRAKFIEIAQIVSTISRLRFSFNAANVVCLAHPPLRQHCAIASQWSST